MRGVEQMPQHSQLVPDPGHYYDNRSPQRIPALQAIPVHGGSGRQRGLRTADALNVLSWLLVAQSLALTLIQKRNSFNECKPPTL